MDTRERLKIVSRLNRLAAKLPKIEAEQEGIENFYKKKFRLSKKSVQKLHMFFSPLIVPPDLTKTEVSICINIYGRAELSKTRDRNIIRFLQYVLKSNTGPFADILKNVLKGKIWAQKEISKVRMPPLVN